MRYWIIGQRLRSLTRGSGLVSHAKRELTDSSDDGGEWRESVLDVIRAFSLYGHSGGSAPPTIATIRALLLYEPLGPLTGEESEWNEVDDGCWQNNRCGNVFKDAERAWDIDARVFVDPNGVTFTKGEESAKTITFPYTPSTEYVDVDEDGEPIAAGSIAHASQGAPND